ncbi:larval serum protein 1 gamma chain-like [Teleopsis dalmanni]|uniref:larval serum protein 1 gamma chain-like n=1 Tax=Teleopsis dalmanni TaxID=139649 RepID=UPI000D32B224|nr:larval serum protein 1 gamma chain-like [Teleopsis dalmanni]
MKLTILLLALVGCVAAASFPYKKEVKIADKDFLFKQKFLFEIVYRVEDPLMFEEWIKFGDKFIVDKSYYTKFDYYMEKFYESYKYGALLPKGEFFGAFAKTHHKQAWGLFNFFYFAKDWDTFMRNVAWARIHVNEGMFVYALTLAVIHRPDFEGLFLPRIYEIFPQYFFNSKFIYEAEKFDYEFWSKYVMYEKEYKDIFYKGKNYYNDNSYFFTKDWKTWQWWKMMGLGEHWYQDDKYFLGTKYTTYSKDPVWIEALHDVKVWWMPVDYTRDIEFYNDESYLSYFTEDLDWNAFWYYLNMDYAFFLDGKTFGLNKDRRGEYWIYTLQQIVARYYQERLSHGYGEIPYFSWYHAYEYGYDPELIYYNGVGYTYRKNYWQFDTYGNYEVFNKIQNYFSRFDHIIDQGYYQMADGTKFDLRDPKAVEYIGNFLQGNIDTFDKFFFNYWYVLAQMYFGDVDYYDFKVYPNVFLNPETMLRDPMFYSFHKLILEKFYYFTYHLKPYTYEELYFPGVAIKEVKFDAFYTYFDFTDFDVTNLLNDKMVFDDGKFVWDKTLLARQSRLNHKPYTYEIFVEADKKQDVVFRVFLGPKFDEYGRVFSLNENRQNFVQIDKFFYTLESGKNDVKRSSKDYFYWVGDYTTYTEYYKYIMFAFEGKYDFPLSITEPHCGFPERLVIPHGWVKGMPMQLFFFVTPYHGDHSQFSNFDYSYSCGVGSGTRYVDELPFGYPFDREIDEFDFFVPNAFFKDVKIFHEEKYEKYFTKQYEHFGSFDYSYYNY